MKVHLFFLLSILFTSVSIGQNTFPLETVLQKGHTDYVRTAAVSPDDQFVVTGGFDYALILWDAKNGKQIRTFIGHTERIRSVVFSPDQRFILSCAADNSVRVFNLITGETVYKLTISNRELYSANFSAGGKYIYALDNRDGLYIWDTDTGLLVGDVKKEYAAHDEKAVINQDETMVLSVAGDNKTSYVFSLPNLDTLKAIAFDKPYSQSFLPDGNRVLISSQKLFAGVYSINSGNEEFLLKSGEERCDGCNTKHAISPDGKWAVTMSNRVGAILWDLRSGKKRKELLKLDKRPKLLKFSPSGKYVLIAFDKDVFVFDVLSGRKSLHLANAIYEYYNFPFFHQKDWLILPEEEGGLAIYDVARGKRVKSIRGFLNVANNGGMELSYTNWLNRSILSYIQHKRKVAVSPIGQHVLIGGIDTSAILVDVHTGKQIHTFHGHSKSVIAFDFSSDGKYLATAGGDRKINIWNLKSNEIVQTLKGHQETVFDLKFTKDSRFLLSGAWDGSLRLWDLSTGTYKYMEFDRNSPYCVGFTPNELYMVTGDLEKNIQFWERDAGEPFRTLIGHTGIPSGFDFSIDGQNMVTSSWDGAVKVWNLLTGMLIAKHTAHDGQVYTVAVHPTKNLVVSGGADAAIVVWDPASNSVLAKLNGHSTAVTNVQFMNNGALLVSMSVDGVMKVWDMTNFELLYTRIQMGQNEWLSTSAYGQFDGSAEALKWVNYVRGNQVMNIERLFETYYTPGLIRTIMQGELKQKDQGAAPDINADGLPELQIALASANKRAVLLDADSVYNSTSETVTIKVLIGKHDVPLDEIRIYNNQKLVMNESLEENIVFRSGEKAHLFELKLSNGLNQISAQVVNQNRVSSEESNVVVEYKGKPQETELYVLAIGINKYKNPAYNLDYAVNDSKDFIKAIEKGADSLFVAVHTYSVLDNKADKSTILATVDEIKAKIGPEDVFLFYYAGHGVMSNEEKGDAEFFIVTHDLTNLYDSPKVVREKALSATELMQISMEVAAEKQLFILDACHSGGAVESFAVRGGEREKALAQLARNTGTFFLTAAQDAQFANEVGKLNHGLFTYALLELLEGNVNNGDKKITVNELKSYAEERVPELTETYHGSPQYPTGYSFGRDFPIVILK